MIYSFKCLTQKLKHYFRKCDRPKAKNIVKKVGLGEDNIPPMELKYTIEKKNFVNEVNLDANWISG